MKLSYNLKTLSHTPTFDLLITLSTLFVIKWIFLQYETTWTFAGPISLLSALAVATWCLNRNKETWKELGLVHSGSFLKLFLWTLFALIVTMAVGSLISLLANHFDLTSNDIPEQVTDAFQNRFDSLPGNIPVYLFWLVVSWVVGGFAEEMLFRGFMITRFEKVFSKIPFAIVIAIVLQAIIFGQQHIYYQGMVGFIATGSIALVSGGIYLLCKRRLWPLILSHGLANTIGMTMLFLGGS